MIFSTLIVTTVLGDVESATSTPLEPLERLQSAITDERRLDGNSKDARWKVGIGHQAGGNAEFYGDGGDGTAIQYSSGGNSKFYGEGAYPTPWVSGGPRKPRWDVGIAHQAGGNAEFYGDGGDGTAIQYSSGGNSKFYGEGAYPTPWVSGGPRNPRWKVGIGHQAGGNAEFYGDGGDGTAILHSSGGNSKFYGAGSYPQQQQQQQQQPWMPTATALPTPSWPTGNPSASASSSAFASAGRRRWDVGIAHQAGGNAQFYGDGGDGTAIKYSTGGNSKFYGAGSYPWQQQQQWMPPSPVDPPVVMPMSKVGRRSVPVPVPPSTGINSMHNGQANFWQGLTPGGTGVGSMWGGNTNFYGGMGGTGINTMHGGLTNFNGGVGALAPGSTGINTMTGGVTNFHRRVEEEVGSLEAPEFNNPVSCEDDEEC